jgi:23S rRNA (cytidine1920-2'-O)/16S rRNA (cytidine1409-2'-O)-methyltransferase
LSALVAERFPELPDSVAAIVAGQVWVNGFPVRNPASHVARDASIVLRLPHALAGEAKLRAAMAAFAPPVAGLVAMDVGAAAGGFTRVLLEAGARRVYAVDAGHGQLLGSLRQDPRVVNLEATNLGALSGQLIPDSIELVVIDVSYISLADAIPQLEAVVFADDAELIALVKPMFELGLDAPPPDAQLPSALANATRGIELAPWTILGSIASPVTGQRGAKELLVRARRRR